MNIGIIGCGYVGISNAVLLAHQENVKLWDIDIKKVKNFFLDILPFTDEELLKGLHNVKKNISIAESLEELICTTQLILIALPTNYNTKCEKLNTLDIEKIIRDVNESNSCKDIYILIRSTVPIGFSDRMKEEFNNIKICFMPEFLREGSPYLDIISPERIVIGGEKEISRKILKIYINNMIKAGNNSDIDYYIMSLKEAESVKLFSNSYLAMRVAFFNELDMYAEDNGMLARNIIKAMCADSRIGKKYNDPSFGYGGYCLPKDTKQLAKQTKFPLLTSISMSNEKRKKYIVNKILHKEGSIGFYRLQSKRGADNTRNSVMLDILYEVSKHGKELFLYEPLLKKDLEIERLTLVSSIEELSEKSNIIIANWLDLELIPYLNKVYTRDTILYIENKKGC